MLRTFNIATVALRHVSTQKIHVESHVVVNQYIVDRDSNNKYLEKLKLNEKLLTPWIISEKEGKIYAAHCDCMARQE